MTNASQRIDEKLRSLGGWRGEARRGEALAEVRRLIVEADPDVVEEAKWVKPSNPQGVPVWTPSRSTATSPSTGRRSAPGS